MQCFYCGFLNLEEGSSLQLLQAASGAAVVCGALVAGGWGRAAVMNSNGHLILWGATADKTQLPQLGEGGTLAALGWEQLMIVMSGQETCVWSLETCQNPSPSMPAAVWTLAAQLRQQVKAVAAGELHSAALTEDGTCWTWGENSEGQLGCGEQASSRPQAILGPQSAAHQQAVVQVACGARHTCALTQDGCLWCWGWSLYGQCGTGAIGVNVTQPVQVDALCGLRVIGVDAGLGHTVVCTDSGGAYSWGWGSEGQLGHGKDASLSQPQLIESGAAASEDIVEVACGSRHTLLMTSHCQVLACGSNKHGQLGTSSHLSVQEPHAMLIPGGLKAQHIACGWWHSLVAC